MVASEEVERMKRIIALLLVFTSCGWSQSFEVASIRLHKIPVSTVGVHVSGQRFTTDAMSLDNLVTYGYDLKRYQVSGVPVWADSNRIDCDRYDIAAKAEGDGTLKQDQAKLMVRALLADRFHLQFHREMKEVPVYALVVARNGHKLKDSSPGAEVLMRVGGGFSGMQLTAVKAGIGVDRPVIDRTQLTGTYDYKLTWAAGLSAPRSDFEAVSVFTALQEQLGLRLEPQKAPVEVLVIDKVEKPSEN
jgi:bla regulator protein BlaR1